MKLADQKAGAAGVSRSIGGISNFSATASGKESAKLADSFAKSPAKPAKVGAATATSGDDQRGSAGNSFARKLDAVPPDWQGAIEQATARQDSLALSQLARKREGASDRALRNAPAEAPDAHYSFAEKQADDAKAIQPSAPAERGTQRVQAMFLLLCDSSVKGEAAHGASAPNRRTGCRGACRPGAGDSTGRIRPGFVETISLPLVDCAPLLLSEG